MRQRVDQIRRRELSYVERRRAEIIAERAKGKTLAAVAKPLGISRQRVFQIASAPRRRDPKLTPASLRHIASSLRRIGLPNFAFTIDQAADRLEHLEGRAE